MPAFPRTATALHDINARARVTARAVTLPLENAEKERYWHAFMERMERELAPTISAMFAETLADPDAPDSVKAVIHATADPANQFDAVLGLFAAAFGIFSIAGAIGAVETESYIHHLQEKLTPTPISAQEAALAQIKGVITSESAVKAGAQNGYNHSQFEALVGITGEPPGIQELLFLFRRGKIDRGRLEHGIRQSRVRDEWIDAIEALEFAPPSAQEAIAAAVQGHISDGDALTVVAQNGIDPSAFGWLLETAGRPPGPEMLIRLLHRGLITRDGVVQGIRESDIKNKYIDDIIASGDYVPPVRSIVAMLRASAISDDRGRQLLAENGVRPDDAAAYIAEAHKTRAGPTRNLTEANIVAAYRDAVIGRQDAQNRLQGLGYDTGEATFLLDLADAEAATALRRQTISTTRSRYVAHRIDHNEASAVLDLAGVAADQRDHLLALWGLERAETTRTLTPAVLVKGVKNGAVSFVDFLAYLGRLGYSDADAQLYAAIEGVGPTGAG